MKKKLSLLAAAAFSFAAGPAFAQTAAPGLYIYAGAGLANPQFADADFGPGSIQRDSDTTATTYHIGAGYRFSANWALEIGYADLGDYSHTFRNSLGDTFDQTTEVKGFKLAVVGTYPVTPRFSIFGKLGASHMRVEADTRLVLSGVETVGTAEKNRNALLAGFGAQYDITRTIAVRAEFESWGRAGNQADTGRFKMSTWNLQGVLNF